MKGSRRPLQKPTGRGVFFLFVTRRFVFFFFLQQCLQTGNRRRRCRRARLQFRKSRIRSRRLRTARFRPLYLSSCECRRRYYHRLYRILFTAARAPEKPADDETLSCSSSGDGYRRNERTRSCYLLRTYRIPRRTPSADARALPVRARTWTVSRRVLAIRPPETSRNGRVFKYHRSYLSGGVTRIHDARGRIRRWALIAALIFSSNYT